VNLRMHADAEHPLRDESSSRGLSCMTRRHMLLHGRDEHQANMTPECLIQLILFRTPSRSRLSPDRNSRECPRSDAVGDVSRPFVALRFPDSSVVTTLVNKRFSFPGGHAPRRWPADARSVSSLVSSPARRLEGRGLESEPEPMGEPLEDLWEPLAVLMREAIIMQSAAINGNQHAIRAPELQHLPRESCPPPGRGVGPAGRGFRQAVGRLVDGRAS